MPEFLAVINIARAGQSYVLKSPHKSLRLPRCQQLINKLSTDIWDDDAQLIELTKLIELICSVLFLSQIQRQKICPF